MSKYLKLYVATELATGTTTGDGTAGSNNKVIDGGQGFELDGISLGDLVSTSAGITQVTAVAATELTVTAGTGVPNATAYKVYSQEGDRSQFQIVPLAQIATVSQASATSTVIQTTAAANDTITITHTSYGTAANQLFAIKILNLMEEAASPSEKPKVIFELEEGTSSIITEIGVA